MRTRHSRYKVRMRRGKGKRDIRTVLLVVFILAAVASFFIWLFVVIDPFQPANPFLREVTIGESVIDQWQYSGFSNGSLHFYNGYNTISLPAESTTFAADGQFVTIDGYTPSTITFEPSYESETFGLSTWIWIFFVLLAMLITLSRRRKTIRPSGFRTRIRSSK